MAALAILRAPPPPAPDIERARGALAQAGFEVTPVVATSFSIVGPASLFERTFPGFDAAKVGAAEQALGLDALPRTARAVLDTVVVEGPLDYGPGNP